MSTPSIVVVTIEDADVAALRALMGTTTSTDQELAEVLAVTRVDGVVSIDAAAALVWRRKASEYAELVDTTESGSSRKNSDLYRNATALALTFEERVKAAQVTSPEAAVKGRTRTRAIRRA